MSLSLASISRGRALKAPRIIIAGVEGVGKSSWAAQAESPVFIPMKGEQGIDEIDVAKLPPCNSYAEVMESIGLLFREDHEFKTAVFDSASAMEPLVWAETCRLNGAAPSIEQVNGGYGKGYTEALKQWREFTEGLDALRDEKGMTIILTGHVVTSEFNDPEADPYTTYSFDIQKKAASLLYRWCDALLFANFKRAAVVKNDVGFNKKASRATGTGQRALFTEKRPAHPGKNRYGLDYELPLDFAKFREALDASRMTPAEAAGAN